MGKYKYVPIAFLLGLSSFCVYMYIYALKEKDILADSLEKNRQEVVILQNERQNLLQSLEKEKEGFQELNRKNHLLREVLKVSGKKINSFFNKIAEEKKNTEELNSQILLLKAENVAIREEGEKIKQEVKRISGLNEEFNLKLSSIPSLKSAIKELKKKQQEEKKRKRQVKKKYIITGGNQGFLIKDGVLYIPSNIKIEVNPVFFEE